MPLLGALLPRQGEMVAQPGEERDGDSEVLMITSGAGKGTGRSVELHSEAAACRSALQPATRAKTSAGTVTTHSPHCEEKTKKSSSGALRKIKSPLPMVKTTENAG